jgi:2-polyprenyl-6-methoxyphenol hydroxylase-like FAD-dependent oxidoreductase
MILRCLSSRKILIAGGGPGGLAAAVALKQAGFEPEVYERGTSLSGGMAFTLWPNALLALESLGMAERLCSESKTFAGLAMCERSGKVLFRIDGNKILKRFGYSGLAVERQHFLEMLMDELDSGCVHFSQRCEGFRQNGSGCTIVLENGKEDTGAALIAADGFQSSIRQELWATPPPRFAGYSVFRGICQTHLDAELAVTSMGRGQQFGYFPMRYDKVYWFASTCFDRIKQMDSKHLLTTVQRDFIPWHDPVPRIMHATRADSVVHNDVYDLDPVERWSSGRVTLLGDAAHPATPDLGQGLCQAIEDAVILASCLRASSDVGNALVQYESHRKPRTRSITLQSRRIGKSGIWTNPIACFLRNRVIAAIPAGLQIRHLDELFQFANYGQSPTSN